MNNFPSNHEGTGNNPADNDSEWQKAMKGVEFHGDQVSAETAEAKEKLPKEVYYINSPDDDTVLIGIDVIIEHGD